MTRRVDDPLLQRALRHLGTDAPEAARVILENAEAIVHDDVQTWSGSEGAVRAFRVDLGVDAAALGTIHSHPHVRDALCSAFAQALADRHGETLAHFDVCWTRVPRTSGAAYRGASWSSADTTDAAVLRAAVIEFLRGAGEFDAQRIMADAATELRADGGSVHVVVSRAREPDAGLAGSAIASVRDTIRTALEALAPQSRIDVR